MNILTIMKVSLRSKIRSIFISNMIFYTTIFIKQKYIHQLNNKHNWMEIIWKQEIYINMSNGKLIIKQYN